MRFLKTNRGSPSLRISNHTISKMFGKWFSQENYRLCANSGSCIIVLVCQWDQSTTQPLLVSGSLCIECFWLVSCWTLSTVFSIEVYRKDGTSMVEITCAQDCYGKKLHLGRYMRSCLVTRMLLVQWKGNSCRRNFFFEIMLFLAGTRESDVWN